MENGSKVPELDTVWGWKEIAHMKGGDAGDGVFYSTGEQGSYQDREIDGS